MPHFTTYWKDDQVIANLGELVDYAASEQFSKVQKGDVVWIVNIQSGTGAFRLIGKIVVDAVLDQGGMKRRYPSTPLYDASLYVCAPKGKEERACSIPIDYYAKDIRFEGESPTLELRNGKVYVQQVRSLRTLTPDSADLFEDIWLDYQGPLKVPSASDYVRAFERLAGRMKPIHRQLLAAQYAAYGRESSTRSLADAVCDGNIGTANLFYGGLAKRLCEQLKVEPSRRRDGSPRWWNVLARGWEGPDGFVWKMRPEVAEALEILGWVQSGGPQENNTHQSGVPDLDEDTPAATEGRRRWRTHLRRERDSGIIRQKKQAYRSATGGLKCEACKFDFDSVFGLSEFCEVHHLLPLAEEDDERTTRLEDLAVLCSNCHRAIHRLGPPMPTVTELRKIVDQSRKTAER